MLFPTLTFYLFFVVVFVLAWTVLGKHNEWRKIFLLLASWVFYGAWDWRFVSLLIASGFFNYLASEAIWHLHGRQRARRAVLIAGVGFNLALLGFFKYFGFFAEQLAAWLEAMGWQRDIPLFEIILPVGISFFTFQGMSYLIDSYRGKTERAELLDLVLLMSFFPHLVAGPIVRASHLIPQFRTMPVLTRSMASASLLLIVWGVFKKVIIASELASGLVDPVFSDPGNHGRAALLFAAYGYAVQIYCDFSAYSDMAIGLAGLLGYRFPRNFNQPYRAASLQDFWRRWHISLSSWLRDYLYISLGGSHYGLARLCLALFLTMLLGGLWHGASWNFVIWGMLHGSVLAAERIWGVLRADYFPQAARVPKALAIVLTFHLVCLAWIFFRLEHYDDAVGYLRGILNGSGSESTLTVWMLLLMAIGMGIHFAPPGIFQKLAERLRMMTAWQAAVLTGIVLLVIEAMRPDGMAAFIYYQF